MKKLRVIDSSCTAESGIRKHTVIVHGVETAVDFEFGKETILPYDSAVKFNMPGFRVEDPETGEELRPSPKTDETIRTRIGPDEIVANYDELTVSALIMRASTLPNGEKFLDNKAKREDIVAFLKAAGVPAAQDDEQEQPEEEPKQETPAPHQQVTLEWVPVQGSSQVNAYAYDEAGSILYVEFKGKFKPVWAYESVSAEKAQGFAASDSKGGFLDANIKKAGHKGIRVEKDSAPAVDAETGLVSAETPDEV